MRTEEDTPLSERVLLVESRADETALTTIGQGLPRRSANEVPLFLSYNYADVPVGRSFDCCYRRSDKGDVAWARTTVVAVTQQFGVEWDTIPHGWKTLTVLRFEPEIPALIRDLPEAAAWFDQRVSLYVSDKDTWEARGTSR
ncbi:hypothetical protein [Streptomyces aurantiogriseus]|uniref:Uncharacterized protein n=1 Tax=Streptomyces aurantiogriseus TaxID=66870 RepID=A0A918C3I0_9ACTN|nr:hypothetical protein [Streptomyces aurantiogriseus]GGR02041.1 hypothetical protein GCM10010251_17200 [Streptomyces aurantiogriseus]